MRDFRTDLLVNRRVAAHGSLTNGVQRAGRPRNAANTLIGVQSNAILHGRCTVVFDHLRPDFGERTAPACRLRGLGSTIRTRWWLGELLSGGVAKKQVGATLGKERAAPAAPTGAVS